MAIFEPKISVIGLYGLLVFLYRSFFGLKKTNIGVQIRNFGGVIQLELVNLPGKYTSSQVRSFSPRMRGRLSVVVHCAASGRSKTALAR